MSLTREEIIPQKFTCPVCAKIAPLNTCLDFSSEPQGGFDVNVAICGECPTDKRVAFINRVRKEIADEKN